MVKKPKKLGTNCLRDKGKAPRCQQCPFPAAGLCEDFCQYLAKIWNKFSHKEDADESMIMGTDQASLLQETLCELEEGYGRYKRQVRFATFINGIYNNRKLRRLRRYHEQPVEMTVIMQVFEDPALTVLGGIVDEERKIRYAFIPKKGKEVSEKAPSLLVVPSDPLEMLVQIAEKKNRIVLVHGKKKPSQDLIDTAVANGNVVLWFPVDTLNGKMLVDTINKKIRTYLDIVVPVGVDPEGGDEGGVEGCPDQDEGERQEVKVRDEGVIKCLEKMLLIEELGTCASYFLLFITVEKGFLKKPAANPEVFLENGEFRKDAIYQNMAETLGKTAEAVSRKYLRCIKEGSIYSYLETCLDGYEL